MNIETRMKIWKEVLASCEGMSRGKEPLEQGKMAQ